MRDGERVPPPQIGSPRLLCGEGNVNLAQCVFAVASRRQTLTSGKQARPLSSAKIAPKKRIGSRVWVLPGALHCMSGGSARGGESRTPAPFSPWVVPRPLDGAASQAAPLGTAACASLPPAAPPPLPSSPVLPLKGPEAAEAAAEKKRMDQRGRA